MGKLINGITGPFLGKVGTGIGSSWKGIPYIKGPYRKRSVKAGDGEKATGMAQRDGHPKDQVMLLAYDIYHRYVGIVIPGQFRETGADSMELSPQEMGTYHIYPAFAAHDRSRQSDSVYLGAIVTG